VEILSGIFFFGGPFAIVAGIVGIVFGSSRVKGA
jgi:hypothetical protein